MRTSNGAIFGHLPSKSIQLWLELRCHGRQRPHPRRPKHFAPPLPHLDSSGGRPAPPNPVTSCRQSGECGGGLARDIAVAIGLSWSGPGEAKRQFMSAHVCSYPYLGRVTVC